MWLPYAAQICPHQTGSMMDNPLFQKVAGGVLTAVVIGIGGGLYSTVRKVDQIENRQDAITTINTKLERISDDVSEMKGDIKVLKDRESRDAHATADTTRARP